MFDASQDSLLRWLVGALLTVVGAAGVGWYKLWAERRLRAAQAESEEAQADKAKSEAHRYDIESMAGVVRTVKEQWVGERELWATKEKLFEEQISQLAAQKKCVEVELAALRSKLPGE